MLLYLRSGSSEATENPNAPHGERVPILPIHACYQDLARRRQS
jgi:hypothetical protein